MTPSFRLMRVRQPRPPIRVLLRQPGTIAGLAVTFGLIFVAGWITSFSEFTMGRGEMPDQPLLKTWRSRLRLSVQGLMALVLILGGGVVGSSTAAGPARGGTTIKRAGGSILIDLQPNYYTQARPWLPMWAIERLGIDFFGTVIQANLTGSSMTDAELCHLEGLTDLQMLLPPRHQGRRRRIGPSEEDESADHAHPLEDEDW